MRTFLLSVVLCLFIHTATSVPNFEVSKQWSSSVTTNTNLAVNIKDFKGDVVVVYDDVPQMTIYASARAYGGIAITGDDDMATRIARSIVNFNYSATGNNVNLVVALKAGAVAPASPSGAPTDWSGSYTSWPVDSSPFPSACPARKRDARSVYSEIIQEAKLQKSSASSTKAQTGILIVLQGLLGLLFWVNEKPSKTVVLFAVFCVFSTLVHGVGYEKDNVTVTVWVQVPRTVALNSVILNTASGAIKVPSRISTSRQCTAGPTSSSGCCSGRGYTTSKGCACDVGYQGANCETAAPALCNVTDAYSYNKWTATYNLTECTVEEHNSYFVIAPDGKRYPTWHPVVHMRTDGTTCTFGHEHGHDPRLFKHWFQVKSHFSHPNFQAYAGLPFGYVNELQSTYPTASFPAFVRNEDHVGHKIMQRHDLLPNAGAEKKTVCDMLQKFHQGTHSADAFTNPLHEFHFFSRCFNRSDNAALPDSTVMGSQLITFGGPSQFHQSPPCRSDQIPVSGETTPFNWNAPIWNDPVQVPSSVLPAPAYGSAGYKSGSDREIGTWDCAARRYLVDPSQPDIHNGMDFSKWSGFFYEIWSAGNADILTASGNRLVRMNGMAIAVFDPSRIYNPTNLTKYPSAVMRTIDLCTYQIPPNRHYRGGACDQAPAGTTWNSPNSPFRGQSRDNYFKPASVNNPNGPIVWYTDVFGQNAATAPNLAAGIVIKQHISQSNVDYPFDIPTAEAEHNNGGLYFGRGVHSPN